MALLVIPAVSWLLSFESCFMWLQFQQQPTLQEMCIRVYVYIQRKTTHTHIKNILIQQLNFRILDKHQYVCAKGLNGLNIFVNRC